MHVRRYEHDVRHQGFTCSRSERLRESRRRAFKVRDDARASCMRDRVHPVQGRVWDKASASRRHEERDAGPNGLGDADEPDSAGGSSSLVGRWRR